MDIRDRKHGSKIYSTCFSAASAVDWLLVNGYVDSRREGVTLCQELVSTQTFLPLTTSATEFKVCCLVSSFCRTRTISTRSSPIIP